MAKEIDKLFKILNKIDYPYLIEKTDAVWYIEGKNIYWNEDGDEEALLEQEGETYSGYLPEGLTTFDGYVVTNVDCCTGTLVTMFFEIDKEVKNG